MLDLNLLELFIEQGNIIIAHGGTSSPTGILIHPLLEQHQFKIDLFQPLFQIPYEKFHTLPTQTWITDI